MEPSSRTDLTSDSYRRSSPIVILSYVIRGFAITGPGKILGLLVKGGGGTIVALYGLSALQSFGVHWSFRLFVVFFSILIVQIVISVFKYFTLQFRYDENKISAKKGFRTQTVIDFDWFNVRSIELTRSAFQRRLNLASISLVTAGDEDDAIEIPYIPLSLALEWEQRVKEQTTHTDDRESGQAETESSAAEIDISSAEQQSKTVHRLSLRKLVHGSIACTNVLGEALIGFIVLGIGYCVYRFLYQIVMLPPNIFELDDSGPFKLLREQVSTTIRDLPTNFAADTTSLAEAFQQFSGIAITQSPQGKPLFFISLALILTVVFLLIFQILYITRYFGFNLTQRGIHLQAEDGLFKKRRLTIRRDRVQTTSFRANFVERRLNRGNVEMDSASKFECRIPYVTNECADGILRSVTEQARTPVTLSPFKQEFTPIHVLSLIQKWVIQVVFLLPITLTLIAYFFPITRGLIWPYSLLLLGYAVIKIYIGWRRKGYIINDDFLLQREGGFSWWSVKVAPLNKVQSMTINQSVVQRIRDRATIRFHFASGVQSIPFLTLSVAEAMQQTVEGGIRGESDTPDDVDEDKAAKEWKSLPLKYIVCSVCTKLLTSFLILIPLFGLIAWGMNSWFSVSYEMLGWILGLAWAALAIWRIVAVCLKIPRFRYAVGEDDIVVKKSLLATETETVRYSRLQSVSTDNGVIDGFFGISNLNLYTAENWVYVNGLDQREALRLRDFIAKRTLEVASTGSDALTMTEQSSSAVDSEATDTPPDTSQKGTESMPESAGISWRKFSGWNREILKSVVQVLLGLPWLVLILAFMIYSANENWVYENQDTVLGAIFGWQFFVGIWLIGSLWLGSEPFIEIPRKGYSVSADALRYKEGWLRREHHFIPLNRIQNVNVSETILDRLFKLSSVKVATAASETVTLKYLSKRDAEKLREELLPD